VIGKGARAIIDTLLTMAPRELVSNGAKPWVTPYVPKAGQTRFDGFDDKILSLYVRGMTVREIQGHWPNFMGPRSRRI
jgi:hypothetical protein